MNQRDKMMIILGQLKSISFPLASTGDIASNTAFYDLIDNIIFQYEELLQKIYPDFEND
jgi:hypothetical protein